LVRATGRHSPQPDLSEIVGEYGHAGIAGNAAVPTASHAIFESSAVTAAQLVASAMLAGSNTYAWTLKKSF
jgi:hypothetical protein